MAALSIAVTATGAVLGIGSLVQCLNFTKNKQVEISEDAVAKSMGVVPCRLRGRCMKMKRRVTLIGDLLIVSYRPGSVDCMISLNGSEVVVADARGAKVAKVISHSGSTLATFWPGTEQEAARWASQFDQANLPSQALPKFLSLNRQQREAILAETAEWEEQIKKVQSNPTIGEAEVIEFKSKVAEQDGRNQRLHEQLASFSEMPKKLSLNRRQIAELVNLVQQKEQQAGELQQQVDDMQDVKKLLSVDRRQIATLQSDAQNTESTLSELQGQLQKLQEIPKLLSFNRKEIATLEATISEKDSMLSGMQATLDNLASEVPKIISSKRKEVFKKETALSTKELKIQELENQLLGYKVVPKILSFNRKQLASLEQRAYDKEMQLEALRKQIAGLPAETAIGA